MATIKGSLDIIKGELQHVTSILGCGPSLNPNSEWRSGEMDGFLILPLDLKLSVEAKINFGIKANRG